MPESAQETPEYIGTRAFRLAAAVPISPYTYLCLKKSAWIRINRMLKTFTDDEPTRRMLQRRVGDGGSYCFHTPYKRASRRAGPGGVRLSGDATPRGGLPPCVTKSILPLTPSQHCGENPRKGRRCAGFLPRGNAEGRPRTETVRHNGQTATTRQAQTYAGSTIGTGVGRQASCCCYGRGPRVCR